MTRHCVGTEKWAQREANITRRAVWCYRDSSGRADGGGFWVYPLSGKATMNPLRRKIAKLTTGVHSQAELDAVVSRAGGLGNLYRTEFSGVAFDEFLSEWDARKRAFRNRMTFEV